MQISVFNCYLVILALIASITTTYIITDLLSSFGFPSILDYQWYVPGRMPRVPWEDGFLAKRMPGEFYIVAETQRYATDVNGWWVANVADICEPARHFAPELVALAYMTGYKHRVIECNENPAYRALVTRMKDATMYSALVWGWCAFLLLSFIPFYTQPGLSAAVLPNWLQRFALAVYHTRRVAPPFRSHIDIAKADNLYRHNARANFHPTEEKFRCAASSFHGHPRLAACRRGAHLAMIDFVHANGLIPYEVSASRRSDKMTNGVGFHDWFTPRDYAYARRNHAIKHDRHVIICVDVDYYIDMPRLLCHMTPIMLYTFRPKTRTGTIDGEAAWHTTGDVVTYDVTGGHTYQHRTWDYSASDFLVVEWGCLRVSYAIEKMTPFENNPHDVVVLQPWAIDFLWMPRAAPLLTYRNMPTGTFRRGNMTRIITDEMDISINSLFYEDAMRRLANSDYVSINEVCGWIRNDKVVMETISPQEAHALSSYWYTEHVVAKRPPPVRHYTRDVLINGLVEPGHGKSPVEDTGIHVLDGSTVFVPTRTRATDAAAVIERLYNVQQDPVIGTEIRGWITEFVGLMAPRALQPLSESEVIARTKKASTRFGMFKARSNHFLLGLVVRVKAFFKAECYTEFKSPRNISPTDSYHQLNVSRVTLAYKDQVLKRLRWYLPGKDPLEMSNVIAAYFDSPRPRKEHDFSRFDGSITRIVRQLVEVEIYRRSFPDHPDLVAQIEREVYSVYATTSAGTYDPNGSRLSGSPLTTDGNTIINGAMQFCGNRKAGMPPAEAFAAIGLGYGDDGATDAACMIVPVAKECGMVVKEVPTYTPERPYATICGRVFPLRGKNWSFQDPLRALGKLGLVNRSPGIDPMSLLAARAFCYYITDRNTPVVGKLMAKIVALAPVPIDDRLIAKVRPYIGRDAPPERTWPGVDPKHREVRALVGRMLGAVDPMVAIEAKIDACTSLHQLVRIIRVTATGPEPNNGYDSHSLFTYYSPLAFGRAAERQTRYNDNIPRNNAQNREPAPRVPRARQPAAGPPAAAAPPAPAAPAAAAPAPAP